MDKILPENLVEIFELGPDKTAPREECEPITIWIKKTYKAKYDLIQSKSNRKFGKFLRQVFEKSIDAVAIDKKAI